MDQSLNELADQGVAYALKLIEQRYEANHLQLPYHNTFHTKGVIRRAVLLAEAMDLSLREVQLVLLSAAFHDVTRLTFPGVVKKGIVRRKWKGGNEYSSMVEMINWVTRFGGDQVTRHEYSLLSQAVMATVVQVKNGIVFQPSLRPNSHPVVRCVAMADIGAAGMEGENIVVEGNLMFRELNMDIEFFVQKLDCCPPPQLQLFKNRIMEWSVNQLRFVKHRKEVFEEDLGDLPETAKERVRKLFCRFDEAIIAVENLIKKREGQDFLFIAQDLWCFTQDSPKPLTN